LALARLTLSRAEQRLKKFGTLWAKEGPQLTQTIRARFPLTGSTQGGAMGPERSTPDEAVTTAP
jgi:hypothetical protein